MKNYNWIIKFSVFIIITIAYILYVSPYFEAKIKKVASEYINKKNTSIENILSEVGQNYNYDTTVFSGISNSSGMKMNTGYANISSTNPKIIAMRNFLLDYNSPMYPYASIFVNEAEKYGLDWRLVASISGVESAFGRITPQNTNNAWGWRAGRTATGERTWSSWANWGDGIEAVTSGLANGYGTNLTPRQIEPTYCPPCAQDPNHPWSGGVSRYMRELDYYLNNL